MFEKIAAEIKQLIAQWEDILNDLPEESFAVPKNKQNRTVRQILGHLIDSASNNTHRVVQLQYRELPLRFHNYATYGNNDKWIAIQNYQEEDREILIQLWKYANLHFAHVIKQVDYEALNNEWIANVNDKVTLKRMVEDYPRHLKLHLSEIEELIH